MRLLQLLALALLMAGFSNGRMHAEANVDDFPLSDWAVGILAADWRGSGGEPIDAFENARLALTRGFAAVGFDPANITDLSLRPGSREGAALSSGEVFAAFAAQARAAPAGCLFYFTSHGLPEGIVLGNEGLLSPAALDRLIADWCGQRPTVVVISACFSGVFLPALAAPHRMIMTAARPDRSSFGCSPESEFPYFDGCLVESLPVADDFIHLSSTTRRCVAWRERLENLTPPSQPLTHVGADVERLFVFLNFERPGMQAQGVAGP